MKITQAPFLLVQFICCLSFSLTIACQIPAKATRSAVGNDSLMRLKVDSRLLAAIREAKTGRIENTVPVTLPEDSTGTVRIEIKARVTESLIKFLRESGASNVKGFSQFDVLQCGLPLSAIEKVAMRKDVDFLRPAPVMQLDVEPR